MVRGSTLALKRAIAPEARRLRADTSEALKPREEGPRKRTACWMDVVMCDARTGCHLLLVKYLARGDVGGALCCRRWMMRRATARTGQRAGSVVLDNPIISPRTPFFWSVNSNVTNVADSSCAVVDDVRSRLQLPVFSRTSQKRKGEDSEEFAVYSPGRNKKKNAIIIMSAMAVLPAKCGAAKATPTIRRKT